MTMTKIILPMADKPKRITRPVKYICTACQRATPRDQLLAKRVEFRSMGRGGKAVRSRTPAWLCSDCLKNDPDWTSERYYSAPGAPDEAANAQPQ